MKYFRTLIVIGSLCLLYSSCVKKENYPDYPVITYNNFIPFCSGTKTDSAYLKVNFTDGNGQIGYPSGDASAPDDFFVIPLVDSVGYYNPLIFPSTTTGRDTILSFGYQIPNITPSGNDKELNGIIQINLENIMQIISTLQSLNNHDFNHLKFEVWMYDLQGNKSNVLVTPASYLCGE